MLRGVGMLFLLNAILWISLAAGRRPQPYYYEYDSQENKFVNKTIVLPDNARVFQDDFLTAFAFKWKSFSQRSAQQDIMIVSIFNDKDNGFFVDLAANDWQVASNTLTVEHFNHWNGVCIEPNPEYLPGLLANRKCKIYTNPVSSSNGQKIKFVFNGGLGGMVGEEFDNKNAAETVELSTVTLETVLDHAQAPKVIDYLSLDVEGAEFYVLVNFNFARYTFLTITIERPLSKIHHLLVRHGYRFVRELSTFGEILYIHHTLPNFVEVMNSHYSPHVSSGWKTDAPNHDYFLHPPWTGIYEPLPGVDKEYIELKKQVGAELAAGHEGIKHPALRRRP